MISLRSFALLAALIGSQTACCIAIVSGDNQMTTTSGGGIANGGSTTVGTGANGGAGSSGGTGASSTTGGACTALDPSPLDFPIAQVGDCIFDPSWEPDGGPGLIAVSVIISTEPLTQGNFGCNTNGPSIWLNYGTPESFQGPALVPGTYEIPGSIDGGSLIAAYSPNGTLGMLASSGSVTFTSISSSEVAGSFNVVFDDGGTSTPLSGTFCAPYFGNLSLPP